MSDRMTPIPFRQLVEWIFAEYEDSGRIFGIPSTKFFYSRTPVPVKIFAETLESPVGPAAGPHTQLAQNIVASYVTGGRFFELKTVQHLDRLAIDKPCIDAEDEGYNVEWSQELSLPQSYDEYLKAWFLLHLLNDVFHFSPLDEKAFIFNMSVGYTLDGIKTAGMDSFIESLKDASSHSSFKEYKKEISDLFGNRGLPQFVKDAEKRKRIVRRTESLSPYISRSVTLSTMHGCPPQEIEAIARYLIGEKGLHTYVKLNPTLLGFNRVKEILASLDYHDVTLDAESFEHDLQFGDAVPMLKRLQEFAASKKKEFGVKLTNTLGVKNHRRLLAGDQMYLSGRALFPLTVNLASRLAAAMSGALNISYSGGISCHNILEVLQAGIYPVTLVTDLLKPGGYARLHQIATTLEGNHQRGHRTAGMIDLSKLSVLAEKALADKEYHKSRRGIASVKMPLSLQKFDCYLAPCAVECPIHQDVAEYIRLVEEKRFADAFEVIVMKNPLPHITGYICDHQCMNKCTRWDYEDPVLIRDLKKVAAENGFDEYLERFTKRFAVARNNIAVAIIGAGPSGLAAAYFLAKAGFDVTIFDRSDKAGGTVQHVIPGFRLPQSAIENDVEFIRLHGVKFEFGMAQAFSIAELKEKGFKYIYLAIGAPTPNRLHVAGAEAAMVEAVEFLRAYNKKTPQKLGRNVAVVGGGNSAMDAARAALRTPGVEQVYLIYRRTKEFMPADREEFDAAIGEGAIFRPLLLPAELAGGHLRCQKMRLEGVGADGRRKVVAVDGEYESIDIDFIISAVGEHVDAGLLRQNAIEFNDSNRVDVEQSTNETSVENVYIGGDALRGPSSVVESIADGKKAAEAIAAKEKIRSGSIPNLDNFFARGPRIEALLQTKGVVASTPPAKDDYLLTKEASRCLACNFICDKCVEVCPNRANIAISSPAMDEGFKDVSQILHIDALCNECGNCETFCPYTAGSPYRSKTTLFWSELEMGESANDGFFIARRDRRANTIDAKVRFEGKTGTLQCDGRGTILTTSITPKAHSTEFRRFAALIAAVSTQHAYLLNSQNR